jgi:hypothetical protein
LRGFCKTLHGRPTKPLEAILKMQNMQADTAHSVSSLYIRSCVAAGGESTSTATCSKQTTGLAIPTTMPFQPLHLMLQAEPLHTHTHTRTHMFGKQAHLHEGADKRRT